MRYLFIANPIAGKGRTKKVIDFLKNYLEERDLDFILIETSRKGEVNEIFQKYKHDFDRIIVVGGDGTLHELVNSDKFNDKIVGVLPTGWERFCFYSWFIEKLKERFRNFA